MTVLDRVAMKAATTYARLTMASPIYREGDAQFQMTVAAVSDLLYFCAVGIVVMGAMATGSSITFDIAAIAAMIGILATVALSRILTRGRR